METLGRYEILGELGRGGCGVVYRALDPGIGRTVAIKTIRTDGSGDSLRERFRREARSAGNLSHPNIVTIHEFNDSGDVMFIAMEFIDGQTLAQRMKGQELPLEFVLATMRSAADALDFAHASNIVHRDVKPANFLITKQGLLKMTDFGIAKMLDSDVSLTNTGMVIGTAQYMSPEQIAAKEVTGRSDQFSLAVIAYEMLTGQRPFQGNSWASMMHSIIVSEPPPLSKYRENLGDVVTEVLRKALAKDPLGRYASCRELSDALERSILGATVERKAYWEGALKAPAMEELAETVLLTPTRTDSTIATGGPPSKMAVAAVTQPTTTREVPPAAAPPGPSISSAEYLSTHVKRHGKRLIAGIAGAVVLAGLGAYYFFRDLPPDSIAVLPFENVGGPPGSEYMGEGIAESIINSLSQLPKLTVRSFSSVSRYRSKDTSPQKAGEALKVQAVLTGRLVHRGGDVSISAELIDVRHDRQIWGIQYNRTSSDLLAVQEQISREVSDRLRFTSTREEQNRLTRGATGNTEAYQLYLQGRYHWNKRTLEDMQQSIDFFEQAIRKDQRYALAYAGEADAYALLADYNVLPAKEVIPKAQAAAGKAIELDGTLAEAHASFAWALYHQWDWAGAEKEFKRALDLNPGYAPAHAYLSDFLMAQGRFKDAVTELNRARELDPASPVFSVAAGMLAYYQREFNSAVEQCQQVATSDPAFVPAYLCVGRANEQKGAYAEAIAGLKKALDLSEGDSNQLAALGHAYATGRQPAEVQKILKELTMRAQQTYVQPTWLAVINLALGQNDQAFDWLEKAFVDRSGALLYLKVDPVFDPVRKDARFEDLMRRVGLVGSN
jgi:serine/threonine protein kinase/TolB-like protein/Flp pilus assembly protein TadD